MSAVAEPALLDTIVGTVASTLKIPAERLDLDADFDSFGMDSIIAIELMTNLSKKLNISITPAQLTAVNSLRELAGAIGGAVAPAPVVAAKPAPATSAVAAPVSAPPRQAAQRPSRPSAGAASARTRSAQVEAASPRRQPQPAVAPSPIERMLRFVQDAYGIVLRNEDFASEAELVDYLLVHHADALSHYYGLDAATETEPAFDFDIDADIEAPIGQTVAPEIAVIGMACAFADADTPDALWRNLQQGHSAIRPLDGDRWPGAQHPEALSTRRWGARIADVDRFDAEFFGLTEDEARMCDPQERLVMQSLYQALRHAGLRADALRGSRTGLFIGYEYSEYEHLLRRNLHRLPTAPAFSSSSPIYYLANRISFLYDFKGPSEVVNASCASSGLAIHRACVALAQGECDIAICGGVSLNLFADDFAAIGKYGLLSPDGRCAVFDDEANGFTRGEGLGLLVLRRLADAERDNHRIFAKVVATHQNNRGRAAFLSEIRHEAITGVIADCYAQHQIAPESIRYIEVDGYATKWGDSFEFEGIRNAFPASPDSKFCALGSIKGNIGHVEPASGVASAIKVALSLHHGCFPATITKRKVNAFIDIDSPAHPLYIADRPLPFPELRRDDEPIRAAVNSFSDSGVNVHLVFEEYRRDAGVDTSLETGPQLLIFSARTAEALVQVIDGCAERLQAGLDGATLESLAYSTQRATEPMTHRVALLAATVKELESLLPRARKLLAEGRTADGNGPIFIGNVRRDGGGRIFDVIQSQIGEDRLLENLRAGQLREVAMLWINGIDIPWAPYWREVAAARRQMGGRGPDLIDLPAYPFAKQLHWLSFDDEQSETSAAKPVDAHAAVPAVSGPIGSGASDRPDETMAFRPRWRFVTDPAVVPANEVASLDAEDKLRLFLVQETARILGRDQARVDEDVDFISLGFDSLGMAGLIQRLIELLSANIAPSIVFKYHDLRSLGRHLAAQHADVIDTIRVEAIDGGAGDASDVKRDPATSREDGLEAWFLNRTSVADGLIVPLQTRATGTPIFAVPGADGSVFPLRALGQSLAGVRPLFAFEAIGVDGSREPLGSVGELADAYIEALSTMRETKEIDLLGYSNGAIIAFEMARRLTERNVRVGRLVLIDQACPNGKGRTSAEDIAAVFADLIPALGGQQALDIEAFARVPEAERADHLYELMQDNAFGISREQFVATYRFAIANDHACRRYKPSRIRKAIRTIVVRATAGAAVGTADLGWNKYLTSQAECIGLDADHLSIVGKDASDRIADIFRDGQSEARMSHSPGA